ncbi:MAG: hypothetical protein VXW83_01880, partial [SAR324 cluster bacterium]|nr:hypothetical protein [SAR324 cluster bacterium]
HQRHELRRIVCRCSERKSREVNGLRRAEKQVTQARSKRALTGFGGAFCVGEKLQKDLND